jgi:uroporphyrin-III C-methyltransferase
MQIDLDVAGRKVVLFGDQRGARRALRRFHASGATVTLACAGELPGLSERLDTVRYVPQPDVADRSGLLRLIGPAWMVVTVGVPEPLRQRVTELAGHLRLLIVDEPPATTAGGVTLVGGGPGRTSLLTLEACAALQTADVIYVDRLAPSDDLARLAPAAELVDVGKSPYHHPVSQTSIQEQLVARARSGQQVVRLKGGDPFVFGRGGEEMHACLAAGIPVRVVPGVSSALAVPAACGIPVTHRGVSRCFTVISGHVPPTATEYEALAQLGGTIVILMGVANLGQIVAGLARAGLSASVPAAMIERGFSDSQRSTFTTVGELAHDARRLDVQSPAVVVIGEVVAAAPRLVGSEELLLALGSLDVASDV